jgi:tellurite methyltransferase
VGEEYAFRGFCLLNLYHLSGSWLLAYLLTTLGFGLGHAYQGLRSTVRTTLVGAVLGAPVVATGMIVPSMIAHAALNIASGLWTSPMLERWGLVEGSEAAGEPRTLEDVGSAVSQGGKKSVDPFWEDEYGDPDVDAFGPPSSEVVALIPRLKAGASVLDLGCGDGRNALPLARAGCVVTAVDKSRRGVERLAATAGAEGLTVKTFVADLATFDLGAGYDLVLAHGVLHLLPPRVSDRLLSRMREATKPGGWNVVAVFTNELPQPPDLAPFVLNPFDEGVLEAAYSGWDVELSESYVLEDEHSGGIRHRHHIDKIVARRPV